MDRELEKHVKEMERNWKPPKRIRIPKEGHYAYTVFLIPPAKGKGYTVLCPALQGCVTEGRNEREALAMTEDAISGWIESLLIDRSRNFEAVPIPEDLWVWHRGPSRKQAIAIAAREFAGEAAEEVNVKKVKIRTANFAFTEFFFAWQFLAFHPMADGNPNNFKKCLEIEPYLANPKTGRTTASRRKAWKDTDLRIHVELGAWIPRKELSKFERRHFPKGCPSMNEDLCSGGKTVEEAVVRLANRVLHYYGMQGRAAKREGPRMRSLQRKLKVARRERGKAVPLEKLLLEGLDSGSPIPMTSVRWKRKSRALFGKARRQKHGKK